MGKKEVYKKYLVPTFPTARGQRFIKRDKRFIKKCQSNAQKENLIIGSCIDRKQQTKFGSVYVKIDKEPGCKIINALKYLLM